MKREEAFKLAIIVLKNQFNYVGNGDSPHPYDVNYNEDFKCVEMFGTNVDDFFWLEEISIAAEAARLSYYCRYDKERGKVVGHIY